MLVDAYNQNFIFEIFRNLTCRDGQKCRYQIFLKWNSGPALCHMEMIWVCKIILIYQRRKIIKHKYMCTHEAHSTKR